MLKHLLLLAMLTMPGGLFYAPHTVNPGTLPCDQLSGAGYVCKNGYSTAWLLTSSYRGPLFTLERVSDNFLTSQDVYPDGTDQANMTTVNNYCGANNANTCVFWEVYNQIDGSACTTQNSSGPVYPIPPILATLTTHSGKTLPYFGKGYDTRNRVAMTNGSGFLNCGSRAVSGGSNGNTPSGSSAVTIYMVSGNGAYVSQGCCYDSGVGEALIADNAPPPTGGAGSMLAVDTYNVTPACTATAWSPSTSTACWIGMEFEDGIAWGEKASTINPPYVILLKTNGTSEFSLEEADAGGSLGQSAALTSVIGQTGGCSPPDTFYHELNSCWFTDATTGNSAFDTGGAPCLAICGDSTGWSNGAGQGAPGAFMEMIVLGSETSDTADSNLMANSFNPRYH